CLARLRDRDAAEDATSDTFLKALERAPAIPRRVQPDGLAPELAALTRRVHERSAVAVPTPHFKTRLRSQLEAAWKPGEATFDHPRRRSWLGTTRRTLAGLAAAALTA